MKIFVVRVTNRTNAVLSGNLVSAAYKQHEVQSLDWSWRPPAPPVCVDEWRRSYLMDCICFIITEGHSLKAVPRIERVIARGNHVFFIPSLCISTSWVVYSVIRLLFVLCSFYFLRLVVFFIHIKPVFFFESGLYV